MRQRTVKSSLVLESVGLHSGKPCKITISPAKANSGVVFCTKKPNSKLETIPALSQYVVEKNLCTALEKNGTFLYTPEHIMSALNAAGIDNAKVFIEGEEFPILDGSSLPIFQAIQQVGVYKQPAIKKVIVITKEVQVEEGDKLARFTPALESSFSFWIDFSERNIPEQSFSFSLDQDSYEQVIAPCRTFGFHKDQAFLNSKKLALGANLENTLIFDAEGKPMNGLRCVDEMVRHKILDAIGDLYFIGEKGGRALYRRKSKPHFKP